MKDIGFIQFLFSQFHLKIYGRNSLTLECESHLRSFIFNIVPHIQPSTNLCSDNTDNLNRFRAWKSGAVNFLIFFHSRSIRHHFYLPSLSPFISGFFYSNSRSNILFVSYEIVISDCFHFFKRIRRHDSFFMKVKEIRSQQKSDAWPLFKTNVIIKTICRRIVSRLIWNRNRWVIWFIFRVTYRIPYWY